MRVQHAVTNAISLATISRIFDQSDAGIARGAAFHNFSRAVAAAIVDNQNFSVPSFFGQVTKEPFQRRPQSLGLIVGGYDNRVLRYPLKFAQVIQSVNVKLPRRK